MIPQFYRMTTLAFPAPPIIRQPPGEAIAFGVGLCRMAGRTISPSDVARVLNAAGVKYVLAGAHAVNAYTGRPRATVDVDVLTESVAKAEKALRAAFPDLDVHDSPVVVRFMDGKLEAIDIMKAPTSKLFRRVVRLSRRVDIEGVEVIVPSPEAVLAMKFASMIFAGRQQPDRFQDASDFLKVLRAQDPINDDLLRELGDLVYAGGGDEVMGYVADARAGRPLAL